MKRTKEMPFKYVESDENYGWIYFFKIKKNFDSKLKFCDLRETHSSLSLRLHAQHGISVRRKHATGNLTNRCLNNFVEATVKFPIDENWKLEGRVFDTEFMFPSAKYDSTYKLIRTDKFTDLINSITKKFHLSNGDLGEIDDYAV